MTPVGFDVRFTSASISPVRSGRVYHGKDVFVGGVPPALVAHERFGAPKDILRIGVHGLGPLDWLEPLRDRWQTQALRRAYAPALDQPWIADLDVTVKPIYGHQQGAEIGYNPHKPGRPSHAYHTIFLRTLRVALDVEVHSGKEHAAMHGLANLWKVWDRLTPSQRPKNVRLGLYSNPSDKAPHIVAVPLVKLVVDQMPLKLDPKKPDSAVLLEMDLQGTANRKSSQTGP